jgi:hypothetical protein
VDSKKAAQGKGKVQPSGSVLAGRYVIDCTLAQRPLLTIYRGYDSAEARWVVLEVLDETLTHDRVLMPRLREEARRTESLIHPNIVRFHGLVEEKGRVFSVRDYVDATTLKDYLAQLARPMSLYEVMQVVQQASAALHHAHRAGILHRSVNPQNIMLRYDGPVLLAGFGLPSLAGISSEADVDSVYLSPEQCAGQKVDYRTDIYSLAVMVYTLCAGQPPFVGTGVDAVKGTPWEKVCWQHVNEPPPFASKLNQDLPKEVSWVLSKALAKHPEERFRSAAEFAVVMKRAAEMAGLDPEAMCLEPPHWQRDPQSLALPQAGRHKSSPVEHPRAVKMGPILWLAGLFLLVILVWGAFLTFVLGGPNRQQTGLSLIQGPPASSSEAGYPLVPTWTPPFIPTPTATRINLNLALPAGTSVPVVSAAGTSGIPFNALRPLGGQFDWGGYVSRTTWRAYTDPRFGFALVHPDGWTLDPDKNVLRLYMPERDAGVVVLSCGTRQADAGQWAERALEMLRRDSPEIKQLEQRPYPGGWLATLAQIPQDGDDIQVAIFSTGKGDRGYAVIFIAWASDWQGVKPIFDQMVRDMRFP